MFHCKEPASFSDECGENGENFLGFCFLAVNFRKVCGFSPEFLGKSNAEHGFEPSHLFLGQPLLNPLGPFSLTVQIFLLKLNPIQQILWKTCIEDI